MCLHPKHCLVIVISNCNQMSVFSHQSFPSSDLVLPAVFAVFPRHACAAGEDQVGGVLVGLDDTVLGGADLPRKVHFTFREACTKNRKSMENIQKLVRFGKVWLLLPKK